MSSSAPTRSAGAESRFLAELQERYVDQGFTFVVNPTRKELPAFLGSYKPDAIARKQGSNIAIEVKLRSNPVTEQSLKDIRRLFEGHPDWKFVVTYMGSDPFRSLTIPASALDSIRDQSEELQALSAAGQRRAAFVMAWSLLEAVLRRVESDKGTRPRTPGTVVQTLATLGYIDPDIEQKVRPLIELRNRIIHGDLEAQPSSEDLQLILLAVEQALGSDENLAGTA